MLKLLSKKLIFILIFWFNISFSMYNLTNENQQNFKKFINEYYLNQNKFSDNQILLEFQNFTILETYYIKNILESIHKLYFINIDYDFILEDISTNIYDFIQKKKGDIIIYYSNNQTEIDVQCIFFFDNLIHNFNLIILYVYTLTIKDINLNNELKEKIYIVLLDYYIELTIFHTKFLNKLNRLKLDIRIQNKIKTKNDLLIDTYLVLKNITKFYNKIIPKEKSIESEYKNLTYINFEDICLKYIEYASIEENKNYLNLNEIFQTYLDLIEYNEDIYKKQINIIQANNKTYINHNDNKEKILTLILSYYILACNYYDKIKNQIDPHEEIYNNLHNKIQNFYINFIKTININEYFPYKALENSKNNKTFLNIFKNIINENIIFNTVIKKSNKEDLNLLKQLNTNEEKFKIKQNTGITFSLLLILSLITKSLKKINTNTVLIFTALGTSITFITMHAYNKFFASSDSQALQNINKRLDELKKL
jgi:hypothetical protein